MLKPDQNFRMKKSLKFLFASEQDPHLRGQLRRAVIQAQLSSAVRPREKKNRNAPDLETV